MKVVADHKIPYLEGAFEGSAEVLYLPGRTISRSHIIDADALVVRTRTKCNKELLTGSKVKCIASATIGYDHIDTDYCEKNNIFWTNAPGCNAASVKQYIASALAYIILHSGKKFPDLSLGIIGAGHVGSKVETMAKRLGIKTLVNDPPRERMEGNNEFVDLETLVKQADMITMHVPLQKTGKDKTFHMADSDFFAKMKKDAWFINSSRGEVADTKALLDALTNKQISGAIIDVWEHEPAISKELLQLTAIGTPHIAGYSSDGKANGTTMSVRAVSRQFKLGLNNWNPKALPKPANPMIRLSCKGKTAEQVFYQLAMHTYDIIKDSLTLKSSVESFEKLREEYPSRREPIAYSIACDQACEPYLEIAKALGFMTIETTDKHKT